MRVALYTTVYPESLSFFRQWSESILAQTCQDFDLCIALDMLEEMDVFAAAGRRFDAQFLMAPTKCTPAGIRNHALLAILDRYDVVILVDSDDILLPTRVEAAMVAARKNDVTATAMELADILGRKLNVSFDPAIEGENITRCNVFGFSNTTWRASVLKACLPVPVDCRLMDWMVAVKAQAAGASIGFDSIPRMLYRQHSGNVATLLPPFSTHQIMSATNLVLGHYDFLIKEKNAFSPEMRDVFSRAHEEVTVFSDTMCLHPELLKSYVHFLNQLPFRAAWWSCVAHPELENIWKS